MSTKSVHIAEVYEWMRAMAKELTGESEFSDSDFDQFRPVDFKAPKAQRVSKVSSDSSERADEDYDEARCDAGVWLKGGYRGQCSCKKKGDTFCSRHQTEADKNDGMVKNGLITGPRPTHHYGNVEDSKALIPWYDVVVEKPEKAPKGASGKRKCGCCGEVGHTKRTCPQNQVEKEVEKEVDDDIVVKMAEMGMDDGAGVGLTDPQGTDTLEIDDTQETDPQEIEPKETDTQSEPEETDPQGDDENHSRVDCTFEGIFYTRCPDTNVVLDDEKYAVGTWVDEAIKFSGLGARNHRMNKAAM